MTPLLDGRHHALVNFRDFIHDGRHHAYRWVDVKKFQLLDTPCDDERLLESLIGHEWFRDDYAGGGVDSAGARHGPYWLDRVTVPAYEPVDERTALAGLRTWADHNGMLPPPLRYALDREVYAQVRAATSRYRLKDLGETAWHDWGGVHGEFHELVLIGRQTGSLVLIVAADD